MEEKKKLEQVHVTISGQVQGVAFRYSALAYARRLGITGWVKNLPDGRVESVAQGERSLLDLFLKWCHSGPPGANVAQVIPQWGEATGEFLKFTIR